MASLLDGAKAKGLHTTAVFGNQLQLLQGRMDILNLVFPQKPESAGPDWISKAKEALEHRMTPFVEAQESAPIQKYRNLVVCAELEADGVNKYMACGCKEDALSASKNLAPKKDALKDLLAACKSLVKDIKSSQKTLAKTMRVDKKQVAEPQVVTNQKASFWNVVGDVCADIGVMRHPLSPHNLGEFKSHEPRIFTGAPGASLTVTLRPFLDKIAAKFRNHALRGTDGRAVKRISDETLAGRCAQGLVAALPPATLVDTSTEERQRHPNLMPVGLVVVPDRDFFAVEADGLASLRLAVEGSRTVVCAPYSTMREVIRLTDGIDSRVSLKHACTFLKHLTVEQATNFPGEMGLFKGTMGPGDIMYMPAGFIVAEVMHNKVDFLGVRLSVLANDQKAVDELKAIHGGGSQQDDDVNKVMVDFAISKIGAARVERRRQEETPEEEARKRSAEKEAERAKEEEEAKRKSLAEKQEVVGSSDKPTEGQLAQVDDVADKVE